MGDTESPAGGAVGEGTGTAPSRRLEGAWKQFEARVLPDHAGQAQRAMMRGAFYGGVMMVLDLLGAEVSDGVDVTASDEALMRGLVKEIDAFLDEVAPLSPGEVKR